MTKQQVARDLDRLAAALSDVEPSRLCTLTRKRARLDLRVSESDKASIEQTARHLGLSVAEYLLRLHQHVHERLS